MCAFEFIEYRYDLFPTEQIFIYCAFVLLVYIKKKFDKQK